MRKLLCLLSLVATASVHADSRPPLAYVPEQANLVIRIEKPRQMVETAVHHELLAELRQLPFVREQVQSPGVQRFLQFIQYYEDDLGVKWPEMLDKLAGHGITLAVKTEENNDNPVLLIFHGMDEAFTKRFFNLAIKAIEQETAREGVNVKPERRTYRGIEGIQFGDAFLAPAGNQLYFSNKKDAIQLALDTYLDKKKSLMDKKGPAEAQAVLPAHPLAWLWFDLDQVHNAPNAKAATAVPTDNVIQLLIAGSTLNAVGRGRFVAAALTHEANTFQFSLRIPGGGRQGMPEGLALHVPAKGPGTLPLLDPPGTIVSHCFYLDLKALWELRGKAFNEKIAADFENGVKQGNAFVPGGTFQQLFNNSGVYHRFVAAERPNTSYSVKPDQHLPAFALVSQMRDPQFAKSAEGIIRAIALFGGAQYGLKISDEVHHDVKIVTYRFPENKVLAEDPAKLRFNFSPSFAVVGNQFLVASTNEFGREMIDVLQRETDASRSSGHSATLRTRFSASGANEALKAFEDQLLGQIILDQAVKPSEAKKQAEQLHNWIAKLGSLEFRSGYEDREYRLDLEWKPQASSARHAPATPKATSR